MKKQSNNTKKLLKFATILVVAGGVVLVGWTVIRAAPGQVSDPFTDETKIGKGTDMVDIDTTAGQVKLPECYTADPGWSLAATTTVRDISVLDDASATTTKDIYCDDNNCILVTSESPPPVTVCVATNSDVYANILWEKTDSSGSSAWGPTDLGIAGDDIGGTHAANTTVGDNNINVGNKNFLERYYVSSVGTYPAMDVCKTKGSGWRLPTILELDSIRDQAKGSSPFTHLPGIASDEYWSSSEASGSSAYRLTFVSGDVSNTSKDNTRRVRCVRGH